MRKFSKSCASAFVVAKCVFVSHSILSGRHENRPVAPGFTVTESDSTATRNCDEAFDLCFQCCLCVRRSSRGDNRLAAIARTYRVPGEGRPRLGAYGTSPEALEDAQRTVGLVRFHAAEWHLDPHKIGVLGFSAGGHLVTAMSTHFKQRLYPDVDAADKESCRPDFAVALYPGHLSLAENSFALNPDIRTHISLQTPPTFLLQCEDDHIDRVEDSLSYYAALKKIGVPVEMHLYAQGGHAFGLRRTKFPVTEWPQLVETWLRSIGMISE